MTIKIFQSFESLWKVYVRIDVVSFIVKEQNAADLTDQ